MCTEPNRTLFGFRKYSDIVWQTHSRIAPPGINCSFCEDLLSYVHLCDIKYFVSYMLFANCMRKGMKIKGVTITNWHLTVDSKVKLF